MTDSFTGADAYHNSRAALCRTPFGALKTGEGVVLRLFLSDRFADADCILCTFHDGREGAVLMDAVRLQNGGACREARLSFDSPGIAGYYFAVNDGRRLLYAGAANGANGVSVLTSSPPRPYQITVYDRDYDTPHWFRNAVAYHIFVDRFARGTQLGGLARASFHTNMGRTVKLHCDWNEQVLFEPLPGKKDYDPCDFYGGDLEGITERLPYLKELGVSCLYLSPLFESPSNHKYNTGDYELIDPMYGTEEDFKTLCARAKELGVRVMLDGVFSHTGDDSRYFNRFGRYEKKGACDSPDSAYFRWYDFYRYPDQYRAWWGFPSLPEVNELEESYLSYTVTGDDAIVKRWIRRGASGWRLDVADELPDEYIERLRAEVKATDPDAVVLGEVWEDASNKISMGGLRRYVLGKELDSAMNYPQRDAVLGFLTGSFGAEQCVSMLETQRENYPAPFYYSCLNLLSSHDVPRALTLLGGGPDKDSGLTRAEQAEFRLSESERALAAQRMKLAAALLMTLPGVPCVYYGDEAGTEGCMDPFNRAPYPWGKEDASLLEVFKEWIAVRNATPALRTGKIAMTSPHRDVLVMLRFITDGLDALGCQTENGAYLLAVNRADSRREVRVDTTALSGQEGEGELPLFEEPQLMAEAGGAIELICVKREAVRLRIEGLSAALYRLR